MEDNNTIFTHAKMEYTSQLIENLTPHMFDGIKSIYDESKVYQNNNDFLKVINTIRGEKDKEAEQQRKWIESIQLQKSKERY